MSSPSNAELVADAATQLETSITAGLTMHSENGRTVQRVSPKEQLDVYDRLRAQQARAARCPFQKIDLRAPTG